MSVLRSELPAVCARKSLSKQHDKHDCVTSKVGRRAETCAESGVLAPVVVPEEERAAIQPGFQ